MTSTIPVLLAAVAVGIAGVALRPSAHRSRLTSPEAHSDRAGWHTLRSEVPGGGRLLDPLRHHLDRLRDHLARSRRRRRGVGADTIAGWCDELSRRVRSGASLRDALAATTSPDPMFDLELEHVRRAVERGQTAEAAVRRLDAHDADLRLAVSVIATAARLGGSPAAAIDRTAAALRRRSADRGERVVQSAQARLSAHVLTVLPVALLAVLVVTDADVRRVITEPIGAACISIGLSINVLGWWWMRRVIGR